MRRHLIVAFAVIASLLVVSAVPVSAASLTVVAQHTTFGTGGGEPAPTTLTNMSVTGSGTSASVTLGGYSYVDGFENEPADAGYPNNWTSEGYSGAAANVTTTKAYEGSQSFRLDGGGAYAKAAPTSVPISNTTKPVTLALWANNSSSKTYLRLKTNGNLFAQLFYKQGSLKWTTSSGGQTLTSSLANKEWIRVTISNLDPNTNTATVSWSAPGSSGSVSNLDTYANFSKGYDNVTTENYGVMYLDAFKIGAKAPQGTYVGANMSASKISQATVNLSLSHASATATWQGWTGSAWTNVSSATYTTGGNKTQSLTGGYDKWRVRVGVSKTGTSPSASIHDTGLEFAPSAPAASNFKPPDGSKVTSRIQTFSVDVTDADFGTAQGDNVEATLYVDGVSKGSQTRSSNGTASVSASLVDGGTHHYYWTLNDSYGQNLTTATRTVSTPATLYIRNVSNTSELVDGNTTVKLRFYSNDTVLQRTTTNGSINLTGLPTGKEFVVTASANGWVNRRTLLPSLYEQNSIYLLNDSKTTVNTTFQLSDVSGQFPAAETKLEVQRAVVLPNNSSVGWVTVAGDYFGATSEFPVALEHNARYRLIVKHNNDRRELGTYIAANPGLQTVRIGTVKWDTNNSTAVTWSTRTYNLTSSNPYPFGYVHFQFRDPANNTTGLHLVIYEQGNKSNELLNKTYAGPFGTLALNESIDHGQVTNKTWVVSWSATRNGKTIGSHRSVMAHKIPLKNPFGSDWTPWVLGLGIIGTAGLFGGVYSNVGAMLVPGVAAIFWYMGWYTLSGGIILLSLVVGVLYNIAGTGGSR